MHSYKIIIFFISINSTFILNTANEDENDYIRQYIGCYQNFSGNLKGFGTLKSCFHLCGRLDTFAALKNGSECHCGNNFEISIQERKCQMRCNESTINYCGGEKYYSIYSTCLIGRYGLSCDKPCSECQNSVPCMKNTGECFLSKCFKNSEDKCDLAPIFNGVNVAFNQLARQSSNYTNALRIFPASLAVDGNNDSNFERGLTCSHTERNADNWLQVDMEVKRSIKRIVIFNRGDRYATRLLNAIISLSNDERSYFVCGIVKNLQNIAINCSSSSKYRYLFVKLPTNEFLTICEIEAFTHECRNNSECSPNEQCEVVSTNNHSRCTCKDGFFKENIYSPCTDIDECRESNKYDTTVTCVNFAGGYFLKCQKGHYLEDENDKFTCKASSNICKIMTWIVCCIAVFLTIIFIIKWRLIRRRSINITPQISSKYDVERVTHSTDRLRGRPVTNEEQCEMTNPVKEMNEYAEIGSKKDYEFQNKFEILSKKSLEEIQRILSSKELTKQTDEWKVYSVDGIPKDYLFASFPSRSDTDKFWKMCTERSNVIILLDCLKDAALPFLANRKAALKCTDFKLKLTNTVKAGIVSVDSISATVDRKVEEQVYENINRIKIVKFSVIRAHLRNNDFLSQEVFLTIKRIAETIIDGHNLERKCSSIFVLSRNDTKLASYFVAYGKLFDQIESQRRNIYTELPENVN